jgi:hypothetical protein
MIDFSNFNFTKAEAAYVVANTPLFIVRNLKNDPSVTKVAANFSSAQIVEELKVRLDTPPQTARDRIIPFILISALGLKQDRAALLAVTQLNTDNYRWMKLVLENTLAGVKPFTRGYIQAERSLTAPLVKNPARNAFSTMQLTA